MELGVPQLTAFRSHTLGSKMQFGCTQLHNARSASSGTFICASQSPKPDLVWKRKGTLPQNVDLPPVLPKKKKKPFPIPLKEIKKTGKDDKKLAQMGIEKPLEPPKNGIIVPHLVPVAYELLDDWKRLIKGVSQLLHVIPVYGCSKCPELHVAHTGHDIQTCQGRTSEKRQGFHSWVRASIDDVLIPIESYHQYDPFGLRVKHETRFDYDRIPAVVELCIQAGVEIPEYPSRRRTKPVRILGRRIIDRGGYVQAPKPKPTSDPSPLVDLDTHGAGTRFPPPTLPELPKIAEETIEAYEAVRRGITQLMRKYTVKACGYCQEVHVGPWGHNVKLCGEYKHQWRDGKHGWQDASVDEIFPANYVWHARDPEGPPLKNALKRFYGKVPAVVELCRQAGAMVPDKYKPLMRLDIVLPDSEEAGLVA